MPELIFNAARHTYHVNGVLYPSITQIIPSDFSMVPPAILKNACERGIAVHRVTELYDLGTLDYSTMKPNLEPFLCAWIDFLEEYEVQIDKRAIEVPGYHPVAMYAGTPDRGAAEYEVRVRGELAVIEEKTVAGMERKLELIKVRRQTAAQLHLVNYWRRRAGYLDKDLYKHRWGVKLDKKGKFRAFLFEEDCDLREFLALTTMMHADVRDGLRRYPTDDAGE